jgi:hypothetical protein
MMSIRQAMRIGIMLSGAVRLPVIGSFLVTGFLFWMLLFTGSSHAKTSNYYLDSTRIDAVVSPITQTASGMVRVYNTSGNPLPLKVIPHLWTLDANGSIVYLPPDAQNNLVENVMMNPEVFEIPGQRNRLVRFAIKLPLDLPDGEYPFQLFFQPIETGESPVLTSSNPSGIQSILEITPIFATTVYALKGSAVPNTSLNEYTCQYDPEKASITTRFSLQNTGNRHTRVLGHVLLQHKNVAGQQTLAQVFKIQKEAMILVFPGQTRTFTDVMPLPQALQMLPAGEYTVDLDLVDERGLQPAVSSSCHFSVN